MIEVSHNVEQTEWGDKVLTPTQPTVAALEPATVNHVVDFYHRYPGETVTLFTCVEIHEPLSDLTLRVALPKQLQLGDYHPPDGLKGVMPRIEVDETGSYLVWLLAGTVPVGSRFEYQAEATVLATYWNIVVTSRAVLNRADQSSLAEETVQFNVWPKGKYLRYLPELYEQDELMGRFLMLFESFWRPIETQIDSTHYYIDPRITPPVFLPWLASWLDLTLDETWPEERLRQLVRWAIALHRSRGTKWGLLKYLEIYTGQQATLSERRAENFILGPEAKLGPGVALGKGNIPHTFTVSLSLPPFEAKNEAERTRLEQLRRQTITSIINLQKPAHTVYTLELEIISAEELAKRKAAAAAVQDSELHVANKDAIAAQSAIWFRLDSA